MGLYAQLQVNVQLKPCVGLAYRYACAPKPLFLRVAACATTFLATAFAAVWCLCKTRFAARVKYSYEGACM